MSVIADCLVYGSMNITKEMGEVNRRLEAIDTQWHQTFNRISFDSAGGVKFFCGEVWAGAFNHLIPGAIIEAITAVDWDYRDEAIVVMDAYDYGSDPWAKSIRQLQEEEAA